MILVCAATGAERRACAWGIAASGARGLVVLRTGVGLSRAGRTLAGQLSRGERPSLVVSSGFAGSLSPGLEPLTWVTGLSVHRLAGGRSTPVELSGRLRCVTPGPVPCAVVSSDEVLASGLPPADLPGRVAVDMESAALAEVAAAAGIPFAVLRLVTDAPGAPLPPIGRAAGAVLASHAALERAELAVQLGAEVARDPAAALRFVRQSLGWCRRLREGWKVFGASLGQAGP